MKNKTPTSSWQEYSFSEIAKNDKFAIVDGPFGTQLHSDEYTETGIPLVRIENLSFSGKFSPENLAFISEKKAKQLNRSRVVPDDLIIAKTGATIGKSGMFPNTFTNGIIASSCMKVSCDPNKVDPKLILYMIVWENGQKKILEGAGGSTRTSINIGPFSDIRLLLPESISEQRKIAEILTTVDDSIEQTEALIHKYQRIKQGLMQDLLRVKETWTVMPLGIACKKGYGSVQTGPFGSQLHSSDYKNEGIPIITVEHLGDNEIIHENLPLVGEEDYLRLSKYKITTGDLVFSRVGAIDRCAYVSENENGWLFSGRLLRVRPGSLFDSMFLSYLLNHYPSRLWILNNSVGSTMKCLNTTILSELPVPIPSIREQKEIGEKISSIDSLIQETVQEMEKLSRIKQGLMQDLLTGKVRVNALLIN